MGNWDFLTPNKCSYGFPLLRTGSLSPTMFSPLAVRDPTSAKRLLEWIHGSTIVNPGGTKQIWLMIWPNLLPEPIIMNICISTYYHIYIHHHIWLRYTVYIHNSYNIYISMPSSSTTSSTIITSSSKTGEKSSSMLIPTKRKYINLRNHHNRRTKVPRCFWLQLPSAPRSNPPFLSFFAEKKVSPQKNWATCFQSENDLAWKKWGLFDVNLSWVDQVETSWVAWF